MGIRLDFRNEISHNRPMTEKNIYRQLVKHFGTQVKAAEAIGCDQSSLSNWCRGKVKPSAQVAFRIEKLTEGKFKAIDLVS